MDDSHRNEELNVTPAATSPVRDSRGSGVHSASVKRRTQRIEEYLEDSLEKEDPLQASLGAGAADLMLIRSQLAESIKAGMGTAGVTLAEYRKEFAPAVNSLLLLDRHIVSYARLGHDLKRAESSEGASLPRRGDQADHNRQS